MRQTIVLVMVLLVGLAGCATPTPNVNPAEIAMTMAAQKVDAEATQMKIGLIYTATAQVVEVTRNAENTQAALAVTAQYRQDAAATDAQGRKDGAATEQRRQNDIAATQQRIRDDEGTRQAVVNMESTAEQGRRDVIGTATAQMVATWNAATMAVMPLHAQWTQQAVSIEQTKAAYDSELSSLNVQQQGAKNTVEWVIPLLIALAVTAMIAVVQIRKSRTKEIRNEETGMVEGLVLDNCMIIRPQLLTGPVLDLSGKVASVPQVADKETQNEVTRRAQAVEALRAMPTQNPTAMASGMMNSVFSLGQRKTPVVEVLTPGQQGTRVILDELSDQVIEEE